MITTIIIVTLWLAMAFFSVRGFLLIDRNGPLDEDIYKVILMAFIGAPLFFFVTILDGHNDRRELFFLPPAATNRREKKKRNVQKHAKTIKAFFGVKGTQ
jgi:hypothetical protein